jgi:hypothetical protein
VNKKFEKLGMKMRELLKVSRGGGAEGSSTRLATSTEACLELSAL